MNRRHQNRRRKLKERDQFYRDAATKKYTYEELGRKYGLSIVWMKELLLRGDKR